MQSPALKLLETVTAVEESVLGWGCGEGGGAGRGGHGESEQTV